MNEAMSSMSFVLFFFGFFKNMWSSTHIQKMEKKARATSDLVMAFDVPKILFAC